MRRRSNVVLLLIAAAVLLVGLASPARAAALCARGAVCMWEDPAYTGEKYVNQPGTSGRYDIDGWDGDNEISSVINRTGKCIRLYANDGWTGRTYLIKKGSNRRNLEQNGYDNQAESYRIYSC